MNAGSFLVKEQKPTTSHLPDYMYRVNIQVTRYKRMGDEFIPDPTFTPIVFARVMENLGALIYRPFWNGVRHAFRRFLEEHKLL